MNTPVVLQRLAACCLVMLAAGVAAPAAPTRLQPRNRPLTPVASAAAPAAKQDAPPSGSSSADKTAQMLIVSGYTNGTIDLSSTGQLRVALLGTASLDVAKVDPSSLTLSGAAVRLLVPASDKGSLTGQVESDLSNDASGHRAAQYDVTTSDLNNDGRPDVVAGFEIQQLSGLEEGLGQLVLTGRLANGKPIEAGMSVVSVGQRLACCKEGGERPSSIWCNTNSIAINDNSTATPYPSTIAVSGETGVIQTLTVTLNTLSHTFPDDIQALLVGPTGQKMILMAGASDGTSSSNVTLTFDDAATNNLPNAGALTTGTFKPTCSTALTNFAAPAPAATTASPFAYTLSSFRGTNPNGTWSLYVRDVFTGDFGTISGGWCMNITTAPSASSCTQLFAGALAAGDPTQTGRLVRNGVFSVCSALKASPGLNDSVTGRRYDTYTLTNSTPVSRCVTASLSNGCGANQIFLAAYSNSYVPTNVLTNYLADNGSSMNGATVLGIGPVGFTMAPGATVVLVVHEITAGSGCASYGLLVEGDICACTVTCPGNIVTTTQLNQCQATVNYAAPTVTGSCGTVTCSPASGSSFPKGVTTVTCTPATGNACTFTVTVNDNQAPSITCPGNQGAVENPPGSGSATVTYPTPTVSDNCPGVGSPTCSPSSGSSFPLGVTTVTCSVTDASMNSASCNFTVTVTAGCAITCPANITTSNDPNQCGKVVTYPPPTTMGSGCGTVTCTPASGSFFPKGTTTVTCNATAASCSFTVTVNDTQPPSITCPANIVTANAAGLCSAVVNFTTPTGADNCPGVTVSCSPPTGSSFPVGVTTVTCTATDASSNTASCSFTVQVNDVQAPSITCPANVTATANTTQNGTPGANVTYPAPGVSDNCAGMINVVCTPASGSFFPQGVTTVTCTATDTGNNSASCTFQVNVTVQFTNCFFDDGTGNQLSIMTDTSSALYGLWQFRIAATGQILQGYAEYLSYVPGRSLVAYDHDSATVRMDLNVNYASKTATATVKDYTTGITYALRDRNILNNPACF